jgi:ribonuclease BN (tRNA processing enzyme)
VVWCAIWSGCCDVRVLTSIAIGALVRVILLGTGGYHPSEERHTACLMLPEAGIVLDAGTAAFRIARHIQTRELDVFLSHAHLDHVVGLTYLLAPLALKQIDVVRLHATEAVLDAVQTHLFSQPIFPVLPPFEMRPLVGSEMTVGQATIRWQTLPSHPGTSMAYRVEVAGPDGRVSSFAYVTDTTVDGSYVDFVRGADVLIHECYFPDAQGQWATKTGHSTTSQVLQLASDAGVGRLVLTHIDPLATGDDPLELEESRAIFSRVEIAADGMEIRL